MQGLHVTGTRGIPHLDLQENQKEWEKYGPEVAQGLGGKHGAAGSSTSATTTMEDSMAGVSPQQGAKYFDIGTPGKTGKHSLEHAIGDSPDRSRQKTNDGGEVEVSSGSSKTLMQCQNHCQQRMMMRRCPRQPRGQQETLVRHQTKMIRGKS